MTAPTPMSDERLAELEAYAEPGCYVKSWYVRELVGEVRRLRELVKVNFDLYHEAMTKLREARGREDMRVLGDADE